MSTNHSFKRLTSVISKMCNFVGLNPCDSTFNISYGWLIYCLAVPPCVVVYTIYVLVRERRGNYKDEEYYENRFTEFVEGFRTEKTSVIQVFISYIFIVKKIQYKSFYLETINIDYDLKSEGFVTQFQIKTLIMAFTSICFVCLAQTISIFLVIIIIYPSIEAVVMTWFAMFPEFVLLMFHLEMTSWLYYISEQFHNLTKLLKANDKININKLLIFHHRIYDNCSRANLLYKQPVCILILVIFYDILTLSYFLFGLAANLRIRSAQINIRIAIGSCMLLTRILSLLMLTKSGRKIKDKAAEFSTVIYDKMMEDGPEDNPYFEKMQLHFMMKKEIKFTALGFFTIDNTLIYSIVGAVATYLIILYDVGPYKEYKVNPKNRNM